MSVLTNEETQRWNAGSREAEGDQALPHSDSNSVGTDVASLSNLDAAGQEVAVTMMLDQARQWLERAKVSTTPAQDVAEFKAFVATVAEAAKQKKLSEDIQLDAVEMVRRSERALGVAIREGQERGEIARRGQGGGTEYAPGAHRPRGDAGMSLPTDFARSHELSSSQGGIYDVTDGVTEEEFDLAITVAKDEGNLSRANVARKVTEIASFKEQQADKWEQIAEFAGRGFTSAQVAKTVGYSEEHLRKSARDRGIVFPADKITGSRRIDPLKVLENTVAAIEATASALDLVTYEDVTPELAIELLERLAPGIKAIRQLTKQLKEIQ